MSELDNFYTACMNCTNTEQQCPGVWKDIPNGIPPRGFFYVQSPVKILVVGKNPGHPLGKNLGNQLNNEVEKYKGKTGDILFNAYRQHQKGFYNDLSVYPEHSSTFHKNLFRYMKYFLNLPENTDISTLYQQFAHTNLVKCSTKEEQGRLAKQTKEVCYQKYFRTELELLRPKVLLALGNEAAKFLLSKKNEHKLPVIRIKHPSYYYSKATEQTILMEIKQEIWIYL